MTRLNEIPDLVGFPNLVSNIESEKQSEILMGALGPNLNNLVKQCPGEKLSLQSIYKLTIQLIERLRVMHELGYIHNDIKLDNILVGLKDSQLLYLIDFGMSSEYLDNDGNHIPKKDLQYFKGNLMFASLNSCRGNTKSRRDDL